MLITSEILDQTSPNKHQNDQKDVMYTLAIYLNRKVQV